MEWEQMKYTHAIVILKPLFDKPKDREQMKYTNIVVIIIPQPDKPMDYEQMKYTNLKEKYMGVLIKEVN